MLARFPSGVTCSPPAPPGQAMGASFEAALDCTGGKRGGARTAGSAATGATLATGVGTGGCCSAADGPAGAGAGAGAAAAAGGGF